MIILGLKVFAQPYSNFTLSCKKEHLNTLWICDRIHPKHIFFFGIFIVPFLYSIYNLTDARQSVSLENLCFTFQIKAGVSKEGETPRNYIKEDTSWEERKRRRKYCNGIRHFMPVFRLNLAKRQRNLFLKMSII